MAKTNKGDSGSEATICAECKHLVEYGYGRECHAKLVTQEYFDFVNGKVYGLTDGAENPRHKNKGDCPDFSPRLPWWRRWFR